MHSAAPPGRPPGATKRSEGPPEPSGAAQPEGGPNDEHIEDDDIAIVTSTVQTPTGEKRVTFDDATAFWDGSPRKATSFVWELPPKTAPPQGGSTGASLTSDDPGHRLRAATWAAADINTAEYIWADERPFDTTADPDYPHVASVYSCDATPRAAPSTSTHRKAVVHVLHRDEDDGDANPLEGWTDRAGYRELIEVWPPRVPSAGCTGCAHGPTNVGYCKDMREVSGSPSYEPGTPIAGELRDRRPHPQNLSRPLRTTQPSPSTNVHDGTSATVASVNAIEPVVLSPVTITGAGEPESAAVHLEGLVDSGASMTIVRADKAATLLSNPSVYATSLAVNDFRGDNQMAHGHVVLADVRVSGGAPVRLPVHILPNLGHDAIVGKDFLKHVTLTSQYRGWTTGHHEYERLDSAGFDAYVHGASHPGGPPPGTNPTTSTAPVTPEAPTPAPTAGPPPAATETIDVCSYAEFQRMLDDGEVEVAYYFADGRDTTTPAEAAIFAVAPDVEAEPPHDSRGLVRQAYRLAKRATAQPDLLQRSDRSAEQQRINAIARSYIAKLKAAFPTVWGPPKFGTARDPDTGELVEHHIRMKPGTVPVRVPPIRLSPTLRAELQKIMLTMLADGRIERCKSPWSSPAFLVKKRPTPGASPDAPTRWRAVIDLRRPNSNMEPIAYGPPRLDDVLEPLIYAKLISSFDEPESFHSQRLAKDSRDCTAFYVEGVGLLRFTTVVMGGATSVAAKQSHLDLVTRPFVLGLDGMPRCLSPPYVDDIVAFQGDRRMGAEVTDADVAQHFNDLHLVLARFEKACIHLHPEKSIFCRLRAAAFGWVVGQGELALDRTRIAPVLDLPEPTTRGELDSFLGRLVYYSKTIHRFEALAGPLRALQQKGQQFVWGETQHQAWKSLLTALTSAPILRLPDHTKRFRAESDASTGGYAGGVLTQCHSVTDANGKNRDAWLPVAFFSKKMGLAQRRLPATQCELWAIVQLLDHFRYELQFKEFDLVSDCLPLKYLRTKDPRQLTVYEWSVLHKLENFRWTFIHRKGEHNALPDVISRPVVMKRKSFAILEIGSGSATTVRALHALAARGEVVRCRAFTYTALETDPVARACTDRVYSRVLADDQDLFATKPSEIWRLGTDVNELAKTYAKGGSFVHWFDLVIGGPSCKSFSAANPAAAGLDGKTSMWQATCAVVRALYQKNRNIKIALECTKFPSHLAGDLKWIDEQLAAANCAREDHDLSLFCGQSRVRSLWVNYPLKAYPLAPLVTWADVITDDFQPPPGRDGQPRVVAPTVMARVDTHSRRDPRNQLVRGGERRYMTLNEEAALQQIDIADLPPGASQRQKYQLVGNAYCQHLIEWLLEAALHPYLVSTVAAITPAGGPPHTESYRSRVRAAGREDPDYQAMLNRPPTGSVARDGLLFRRTEVGDVVWLPNDPALQQEAIAMAHDSPEAGHPGVAATTARLITLCWFRGVGAKVEQYVKSCKICAISKHSTVRTSTAMHPAPVPGAPSRRLFADFKAMPSSGGFDALLVIVDGFTGYVMLLPTTREATARETWVLYQTHVLPVLGVPGSIVSDRGPQFSASLWRNVLKGLGGRSDLVAAHNPAANGAVERRNRDIAVKMRQLAHTVTDAAGNVAGLQRWPEMVGVWAFALNSSRRESGHTANWLQFGRELNGAAALSVRGPVLDEHTGLDEYAQALHKRIQRAWDEQRAALERVRARRRAHQSTRPQQTFEAGELVYLRKHRAGQRSTPGAGVRGSAVPSRGAPQGTHGGGAAGHLQASPARGGPSPPGIPGALPEAVRLKRQERVSERPAGGGSRHPGERRHRRYQVEGSQVYTPVVPGQDPAQHRVSRAHGERDPIETAATLPEAAVRVGQEAHGQEPPESARYRRR